MTSRPKDELEVRLARHDDCFDILSWRNDSGTQINSFSGKKISPDDHKKWFLQALSDINIKLFIAEKVCKIGVCRFEFDSKKQVSIVSINLAPSFRGLGFGYSFLSKSIVVYRSSNCLPINAEVKIDNEASNKLFSKCGFKLLKTMHNKNIYQYL